MVIIKRVYYFLVNIGKIIAIIIGYFLIAIFIVSISIKNQKIEDKNCKIFEKKEIVLNGKYAPNYSYYYRCNTLYIIIDKAYLESDKIEEYLKNNLKDNQVPFVHIEIIFSNGNIEYYSFKN